MTVNDLIRRLEHVKQRNPNAAVVILESTADKAHASSPRFAEMMNGSVINPGFDPFEKTQRPLETLVMYGELTAMDEGF